MKLTAARSILLCSTLVPCVASGASCSRDSDDPPSVTDDVVAIVGDGQVTAAELRAALSDEPTFRKEKLQDRKEQLAFVHKYLEQEILYQEALQRKVDRLPRVRRALKAIVVEELKRIVKEQFERPDVPDDVKRRVQDELQRKLEAAWYKKVCLLELQDRQTAEKAAGEAARGGGEWAVVNRWASTYSPRACQVEVLSGQSRHEQSLQQAVRPLSQRGDVAGPFSYRQRWYVAVLLGQRSWNRGFDGMQKALEHQARAELGIKALRDVIDRYWSEGKVVVNEDVAARAVADGTGD